GRRPGPVVPQGSRCRQTRYADRRVSRPSPGGRLRARRDAAPVSSGGDDRLVELTRRLAAIAAELGLTEIEVESAGTRLRVQRAGAPTAPVVHAVAAPIVR